VATAAVLNDALVEASSEGRTEVVRMLLAMPAKRYVPPADVLNDALFEARKSRHPVIVNMLLSYALNKYDSRHVDVELV